MLAPRNLLKSNATTFDRLLRLVDPLVIVIVGWGSYLIYLGSAVLPSNYWVALLGAALLGIAVFPETGLYQPKRGASLADDLRALTYGWSVVVALGIMVAFLTKTSDSYSRVWVASSAAAGLLVDAALRMPSPAGICHCTAGSVAWSADWPAAAASGAMAARPDGLADSVLVPVVTVDGPTATGVPEDGPPVGV